MQLQIDQALNTGRLAAVNIETPYQQFCTTVVNDWIDYNGHMNVGYYHVVFDAAVEPFFGWLGLSHDLRRKHGGSTFALEAHLNYFREVVEGDEIRFETRLVAFDHKRIHYYQEMYHGEQNYLAASHESLSTWVDMATRRSAPLPIEIMERLTMVLEQHRALDRPWQLGHTIAINRAEN